MSIGSFRRAPSRARIYRSARKPEPERFRPGAAACSGRLGAGCAASPNVSPKVRRAWTVGAGLVRDAPAFMRYRDRRSVTPHTCNAERAEEAAAAMDEFLRDARFLLAALRGRDDATD